MTAKRRPRWWVWTLGILGGAGVMAAIVAASTGGTGSAASLLTATASVTDVTQSVQASGSLVDEYTYSIAADGTATLALIAGVATATSPAAVSSAVGTTEEVDVAAGQPVAKGDTLARVSNGSSRSTRVDSPVAGTVRSVATAVGAVAGTVATIGSGAALAAIQVDENRIGEVRVGQDVTLTFGTDASPYQGTVQSIAQSTSSGSQPARYQVLVQPKSLPAQARIGMTTAATIMIATHPGVIAVPLSAVVEDGSGTAVEVVEDDATVRLTPVTLGLIGDSVVEIASGLEAGTEVSIGTSGTVPAPADFPPPPAS